MISLTPKGEIGLYLIEHNSVFFGEGKIRPNKNTILTLRSRATVGLYLNLDLYEEAINL